MRGRNHRGSAGGWPALLGTRVAGASALSPRGVLGCSRRGQGWGRPNCPVSWSAPPHTRTHQSGAGTLKGHPREGFGCFPSFSRGLPPPDSRRGDSVVGRRWPMPARGAGCRGLTAAHAGPGSSVGVRGTGCDPPASLSPPPGARLPPWGHERAPSGRPRLRGPWADPVAPRGCPTCPRLCSEAGPAPVPRARLMACAEQRPPCVTSAHASPPCRSNCPERRDRAGTEPGLRPARRRTV